MTQQALSKKIQQNRQSWLPWVGQRVQVDRLGLCQVKRVHPAGTIDVECPEGNWYRVSGLSFT